MEVMMCGADP
jgi:hypothetical protein